MRRILALFLAAILVLNLGCLTAFANTALDYSVSASPETLEIGDTVTATVSIGSCSALAGFSIKLNYDTDKLTLVSAAKGSGLSSGSELGETTLIYTAANSSGYTTEGGTLFTATFTAKAAGEAEFSLEFVNGDTPRDTSEMDFTPNLTGDSVTIAGAAVPATSVTITEGETASVAMGGSLTLHATVAPEDATDSVAWSSETTDVATIDAATGAVTPVSTGTSVITAKAGEQSDTLTLTVTEAPETITVSVAAYDYAAKTAGIAGASANGVVLAPTNVEVSSDATAYDAFAKVFTDQSIAFATQYGNYFSSINGLAAAVEGYPESGWVFSVNDDFGNLGTADQTLTAGDRLEMHYSMTGYGSDVGCFWAPYIPTITSFTLDGVKKTISYDVTPGTYPAPDVLAYKVDGEDMAGSGTSADPFVIPIELSEGTDLSALTASVETGLHEEYWSLYEDTDVVDITESQDYTGDVVFAIQTRGGVLKTYYIVQAELPAPEAESISAINVFDYDDDEEGTAYDGVYWQTDGGDYPVLNIVDSDLSGTGNLKLPMEITFEPEGSACTLYPYVLNADWDLIDGAASIDAEGNLLLDKEKMSTPGCGTCILINKSGLDVNGVIGALDDPDNNICGIFYFNILPGNIKMYIGDTETGTAVLTASYDANGKFSPTSFVMELKYSMDGELVTDSYLWRNLFVITSENTNVATVSGFTVRPKARGTSNLTFALSVDFWSGFSALSFPASVSVGMEADEATAAVIDLIRALPDAESVTAFEKAAIEAARAAYTALDAEKQAKVTNYAHLTAAEAALSIAMAGGPLYAMRYVTVSTSGSSSERNVEQPFNGCTEWRFKGLVGSSYQSCVLKGAVDATITAVKVDDESAALADGVFQATLSRGDSAGMKLHKVELFTGEGGVTLNKTVYVISAWEGFPTVMSLRLNAYTDSDSTATLSGGSYDAGGNFISPALAIDDYEGSISIYTSGSYPNFSYIYAISRFKAAYSLSGAFCPVLQLNIGSDSCDYEVFDPYTGTVIAERMLSEGDDASKPINSGSPVTANVGANLYFMRIWPVSYNGSTYTRRDTAPSVLAFYIDRADETVSDEISVNSITAAGTVKAGSYEVAQSGKQYAIEADWNESDVTCTVKVPQGITYKSLSTTSVTGSSYGSKSAVTDTVEDGVRTLTFNWWTYNSRTQDSYEDYEVLHTLTLLAEDGVTEDVYKITLKRPAGSMDGETDADLKSLSVNNGNVLTYQQDGVTKTGFDPAVTDYAVTLTPNTTSFYITALSKFIAKGAAVAINGRGTIQIATNSYAGKSETFPVSAGMDPLVLTIVVTPPEGSTMGTKTYTVTFTKPVASTGDPRITGWQMTTGSSNQLMAPDTTGSGECIFSATVALTAYNSEGTQIYLSMLYRYTEATIRGSVDCNCSKVTLTPTIAMSSCPLVFSYSVNGGEEIKVEGVSPTAFNIPVPNAGLNTIRVFIRDEQGTITKTHTFEITKGENASLKSITSEDAAFVGKFNPTIYRMNMLVEPGTGAISVTATAEQATAAIDFNGVTGTGSVTATGLVVDTEYQIRITSGETSVIYYLTIKERQSISANSVWAVMPAPGQFVNEHSQTVTGTLGAQGWGDGWGTTLYGATSTQAGRSNYSNPGYSLGWFGGFITYEFDDPILNSDTNKYGIDFTVYGNAFYGNAEPAGVEVSADGVNWYTLAGSKHYEDDTVWDYAITYYNPDPDFDPYLAKDVYWTDNQGGDGYFLATAGYHPQPAYPVGENYCFEGNHANSLYSAEQLTLTGTKVSWGEDLFFGYTDVHPNQTSDFDKPGNPYRATDLDGVHELEYVEGGDYGDGFDISWAVDENGYPVNLESIKYVKVYTAVADYNVGEVSPEILAIARTTGESASVGQTAAPTITVNGKTLALTEGVYEYDVEVNGAVSISAALEGANVWVNNNQLGSFEAESVEDGRIVRIITQKDESEPVIYYLTLENGEAPVITDVKVVPTAATNDKVTVTIEATDNVGVTVYSFNGGVSWQAESSKQYTENTTIAAGDIRVKDALGNETLWANAVVIGNIERVAPTNTNAFIQTANESAKGVLTVTAADASGIASVQVTGPDDYDVTKTTAPYTFSITKAGSYTVTVTDNAGNTNTSNTKVNIAFITVNTVSIEAKNTGDEAELADSVLNIEMDQSGTKSFDLKAVLAPDGADDIFTTTWSSSTPSVATVDSNGTVTVYTAGLAVVTAEAGGKSANLLVEVKKTGVSPVNSAADLEDIADTVLPDPVSVGETLTGDQKAQLEAVVEMMQELSTAKKTTVSDELIKKVDALMKKAGYSGLTLKIEATSDEKVPEKDRIDPEGNHSAVGLIAAAGSTDLSNTTIALHVDQEKAASGMKYTFDLSFDFGEKEDTQLASPILVTIEMPEGYVHNSNYKVKHTKKDGSIEWLAMTYDAEANTVTFRVNSLSPFSIGIKPSSKSKSKGSSTKEDTDRVIYVVNAVEEENPNTGFDFGGSGNLPMLLLAPFAALFGNKKHRIK